jgi:hypothetical protein
MGSHGMLFIPWVCSAEVNGSHGTAFMPWACSGFFGELNHFHEATVFAVASSLRERMRRL